MGIAESIVDNKFFESYLGMRVETVDMTEFLRRMEESHVHAVLESVANLEIFCCGGQCQDKSIGDFFFDDDTAGRGAGLPCEPKAAYGGELYGKF